MQDFHELTVWKRAHALVLQIYQESKQLPTTENFGLVLHLRRSAVQLARQIAQGAGEDSREEFALALKKARATGHELEYMLLLSFDLGYLTPAVHQELSAEVIEVRKMISGLLKRLAGQPEAAR